MNINVLLKIVVMRAAIAIADGCWCGPQSCAPKRRRRRRCALWQLRDAIAIARRLAGEDHDAARF